MGRRHSPNSVRTRRPDMLSELAQGHSQWEERGFDLASKGLDLSAFSIVGSLFESAFKMWITNKNSYWSSKYQRTHRGRVNHKRLFHLTWDNREPDPQGFSFSEATWCLRNLGTANKRAPHPVCRAGAASSEEHTFPAAGYIKQSSWKCEPGAISGSSKVSGCLSFTLCFHSFPIEKWHSAWC